MIFPDNDNSIRVSTGIIVINNVHIPRLTAFARRPSGPLPAGQR